MANSRRSISKSASLYVATSLVWLLLACVSNAWAAAPRIFAVAAIPMSLPVFVAQADGLFAAQGLSIRVDQCEFGKRCLDQLLDGRADFCTVADLPIVMASLKSNRLAIIATIATNSDDAKIVARKSGPIHSVTDLRGKTIGVNLGTSGQYFLDSVALLTGVDPATFHLVDLPVIEMQAALKERRIDAVSVFEPGAQQITRALGSDALVLRSSHLYTLTWNVVETSEMASAGDEDAMQLLRALDSAIDRIARDPGHAKAILKEKLRLDDESVARIWPELSFGLEIQQSLIKTMEGEARWALRRGQLNSREPNYLKFIHEGPLKLVKPGAVAIVR